MRNEGLLAREELALDPSGIKPSQEEFQQGTYLMKNSKCPLHILFIFKPNFYGIEAMGLKAPPDCSSASQ